MKRIITVAEIVSDVESGMRNEDFSVKYGLSESGLLTFLQKSIKAVAADSSHIEIESEEE